LTGTPEGVSEMVPGQEVRVEIDGIGMLRNSVASGAPATDESDA
jgi:2-keto-4-pentenoate hydratase/2-oxohepta-3-ene-1,7-dioic acid hydratase in catechol pathway